MQRGFDGFGFGMGIRNLASGAQMDEDVHILTMQMPSILDSTEGRVTKWLRSPGESVYPGASICRVQLDDMEIEMDSPFRGVLADILVKEYVTVPLEEDICVVCDSQEAYMAYFERRRVATLEAEKERSSVTDTVTEESPVLVVEEIAADSGARDSTAVNCLRHLKKLHIEGFVEASLYESLQKLARRGDKELLIIYRASYASDEDAESSNDSAFDLAYFIESATAAVSSSA